MNRHDRNRTSCSRVCVAALVAAVALAAIRPASALPKNPVSIEAPRPSFREVWAYLMRGEEKEITGSEPLSDVCYFSANLNREGRITATIGRPPLAVADGRTPRIHLVIAELSNESLMHFTLDPEYGITPRLVEDICRVAQPFDGVQIDFESVARADASYFFDFLQDLKEALPAGKALSVAVPARTVPIADAYDYARIASVADRVVIMAYDEHYSSSPPGPVASLSWCAKVVDFAQGAVSMDKIVMGLPLYGRAWQDKRLARALRFKNVQDLMTEKGSTTSYDPNQGAFFEYSENVVVTVFYDDARSIAEKLQLYQARAVNGVAFWRIGMGFPELWTGIALTEPGDPSGDSTAASAPTPQPKVSGSPPDQDQVPSR